MIIDVTSKINFVKIYINVQTDMIIQFESIYSSNKELKKISGMTYDGVCLEFEQILPEEINFSEYEALEKNQLDNSDNYA